MEAPTPLLSGVDAKDLAIGINIQGQVGPNRTITMTLGVPMTMTLPDLNGFMDKAMSVLDRQNNMGIAEALKIELERAEKEIAAQRTHRAQYISECAAKWEQSNRKGDFQINGAQQAQVSNFDKSINEIADNRIPKLRKEIADIERKLNGGG